MPKAKSHLFCTCCILLWEKVNHTFILHKCRTCSFKLCKCKKNQICPLGFLRYLCVWGGRGVSLDEWDTHCLRWLGVARVVAQCHMSKSHSRSNTYCANSSTSKGGYLPIKHFRSWKLPTTYTTFLSTHQASPSCGNCGVAGSVLISAPNRVQKSSSVISEIHALALSLTPAQGCLTDCYDQTLQFCTLKTTVVYPTFDKQI